MIEEGDTIIIKMHGKNTQLVRTLNWFKGNNLDELGTMITVSRKGEQKIGKTRVSD